MIEKNRPSRASALVMSFVLFSLMLIASPFQSASSQLSVVTEDFVIDLSFSPGIVESGIATYPAGYVQLISTKTGAPVLAPRDLEIELNSRSSDFLSVPSRVVISEGNDYVKFDLSVLSSSAGETEVSALFGNQIVSKVFKVVEAHGQIPDNIALVVNVASDKMQVTSEAPFSVYLENEGNILQVPEDITVTFSYEKSLVQLGSDKLVIKRGSYYAIGTLKTLEQAGNAFIKATTTNPPLTTVTNIDISNTRPASLKTYVFPDKIGLEERAIDVFVGILDSSGQPTQAPEDIHLELFSSSNQVIGISDVNAVIKKGQFGFYVRQPVLFFDKADNIAVGATSSGLGVSTDTFSVMDCSLSAGNPRAAQRSLSVFTPGVAPSDTSSIATYQIYTIEDDIDDTDYNHDKKFEFATGQPDDSDADNDGFFDEKRDVNKDGVIDLKDYHCMDDLSSGAAFPVQMVVLFSPDQQNLTVVSGDNSAATIGDPGALQAGASFGTAVISSGRRTVTTGISASLADMASGTGNLLVVGGLNPTQTKILSAAGQASDEAKNYRIPFNEEGYSDMFLVTLDSQGRPSSSEKGTKYLVKPVNELAEIGPNKSYVGMRVQSNAFGATATSAQITAVPVGVNSDTTLQGQSTVNLIFFGGTTSKVVFPFKSLVGFSKEHQAGTVQLTDQLGNPILASEDVVVKLTSSVPGALRTSTVTIPAGSSFANFAFTTSGKKDAITITASAEGVRSSSAEIGSILPELPGSFVKKENLVANVPGNVTIATVEGASILWGVPVDLEILVRDEKAIKYDSSTNMYLANLQLLSTKTGTYTIDAVLLKDGYSQTKVSGAVVFEPKLAPLRVLVNYDPSELGYGQTATMTVFVETDGLPVPDALVSIDAGLNATAEPTNVLTDVNGMATFLYTPKGDVSKLNLITTAYKDGYKAARDIQTFETVAGSSFLPFCSLLSALPYCSIPLGGTSPWVAYVGIVAIAGGIGGFMYFFKRPKGTSQADEYDMDMDEDLEEEVEEEEQEEEET